MVADDDHDAAGRLDPLEQRLVRQAEMEADDFRLQLLDQFAHRGIERRAVGGVDRRRRIEPQLPVIWREPLLPSGLALRIGVDRSVAKEIHIDRRRYPLPDDIDLLARLLDRQHRAWQRAQRPALRRRDHQFRVHDACHRRQNDGKFGLEKIEKSAVWPHGLLVWRVGGIGVGIVAAVQMQN